MPTFKVLSIAGGGIKGLYSATILQQFEAALRRQHGDDARIADYVDLVLAIRSPFRVTVDGLKGPGEGVSDECDQLV